jgi:hypothetical protein
MNRNADWLDSLWAVIDASLETPFEYGHHDCCLFAATCVDAMCGTAHAAYLSGQWKDEASAAEFIASHGTIVRAVTSILGIEPVLGWVRARRGDVCLVPTERGMGAGICVGDTIAVAAEIGVAFYPITTAEMVWRIGE